MHLCKKHSFISGRSLHYALLMMAVYPVILLGCSDEPVRMAMPQIDARAAGQQALTQYDTDGDGKISGEELDRVPALKHTLPNLDIDGDQGLSAKEITAQIESWHRSKVARLVGIFCTVNRGGKPLQGATVILEPEKFLGQSVPPATGVSGPRGQVNLSAPVEGPGDIPGIAPGFYKVRITKPGLDIPAKYNSQTVLGQEVSQKAAAVSQGMHFDVQ